MTSKNKFGFGPLETKSAVSPRNRSVGPMGAAVREAAESLTETTEAKVEQRRRNAEDAKSFRSAVDEGRVLTAVPLSDIHTTDLPRDRIDLDAVASSDEMEELKTSIRERGQKEPVELYSDHRGRLQLKKGWRRFTALSQLLSETGDERFSTVLARVVDGQEDRLSRYIDMVEENVVREDLTFAEMAQVAILAAGDDATDEADAEAMVSRLYGALHKMKRSYIRSFVQLLQTVGDDLKFPKAVSRNVGVEVSRMIKKKGAIGPLRTALYQCATPEDQAAVLARYVSEEAPSTKPAREKREKREFHVAEYKVTARKRELRLVCEADFTAVPRDVLERAISALKAEIDAG